MTEQLTEQSIFDTVVAHLRSMPTRSTRQGLGSCAYRGANGNKCAVGALIRDDEYSELMDTMPQTSVRALVTEQLLPARLVPFVSLLEVLQLAHDWMDNWGDDGFVDEEALKEIAENFNLTYTPKEA